MNSTLFIVLGIALVAFLLPAFVYSVLVKKNKPFNMENTLKESVFLPVFITLFLLSNALFFIFYDPKQFLSSVSYLMLVTPFVAIFMVYLSLYNKYTSKYFLLFLFLATVIGTLIMPDECFINISPLPVIYNRLILCAAWFVFSFIYRYANSGDSMLSTQSITIAGGIGILGMINAIPPLLGYLGFIFTCAFATLFPFTYFPSRLRISSQTASCFGFLLFIPCAWVAAENAASCIIIFSMYLLIDTAWAIVLRLTFLDKYADISQNTAYKQALEDGIPPSTAISFSYRGQLLLLFLGSFQAVASYQASLLLVSSLITLWFLYRFHNIYEQIGSFRDINHQVLEDLQDKIDDIKQLIGRDDSFK